MSLLDVQHLTMRFGGLTAVSDVSFAVAPGEILAIIGPNGAGKTTVFNALSGVYEPSEGRILFRGAEQRRPFGPRVAARIVAGALLTGVLAVAALLLEPLWAAAIESNYRFRQPFPWGEAVADLGGALWARATLTAIAFLVGAGLGGAGTWVIWQRQRRTPDVVAGSGICRTFQNIRLFQHMTVLENVLVALHPRMRTGVGAALLRLPAARREEAAARAEARTFLDIVSLADRADTLARNLPYGDQRRLEIARALALKPTVLLLDEPTSGMNPQETQAVTRLIREVRQRFDLTVLLIEHHMKVVMGISDRIVVLDHGARIAEGAPQDVARDPAVIEAYLGRRDEDIE